MGKELKTQKSAQDPRDFIEAVVDPEQRTDSRKLLTMMQKISGEQPTMWGDSMVGFGSYHYKYASGREGEWFKLGFSPRKQNLTLYLCGFMYGFEKEDKLFDQLGKHSLGKGCLYIKRLRDIDVSVLEKLIKKSFDQTPETFTAGSA